MADKRRFYNTGDAKGFGKADYFAAVARLVDGETLDGATLALVADATAYELEGIANRTNSAAVSGERKDPLQSEYALGLAAAIVPLISKTPQTAKQLIDAAEAAGSVSPKGGKWAAPWVSRVLNAIVNAGDQGITLDKIVVDTVDTKGLKSQKEVVAYFRA